MYISEEKTINNNLVLYAKVKRQNEFNDDWFNKALYKRIMENMK